MGDVFTEHTPSRRPLRSARCQYSGRL